MSFDEDFESLGRKPARVPAPSQESASPEDLLFAVPEAPEEELRNPYEQDAGFDDGMIDGGLGPQNVDGILGGVGAGAPSGPSDSELAKLFLDDDDDAPMSGESEFGIPQAPSVSHAPLSESLGDDLFDLSGSDSEDEFDEPESRMQAEPIAVEPAGVASPAPPPPSPVAPPAARIPGRNRVSYSQGRAAAVDRDYRPASDPLNPVVEPPRRAGFLWLVPFAAFLIAASFAAYYFLRVGSPVLSGVAFSVGALAALFCRVLFRR